LTWTDIKRSIPDEGFAPKYEVYRRARPTVTLVILRTVTDPILFRSTDPERAETQVFNNVIHAQVNGEKFVSKERLTGLNLCRELDETENIIAKGYTYNEPMNSLPKSQTADMLTYGLAGTVSGATFSQKSHVIEGYTYSLEQYDLMNREAHNALYESGTMRDEEGNQSESFFHPVKVQPNTHFVHFITLEAGTKEMLLYVIHNILNTGRYGARETRTGRNMKNEIVGVITSSGDSSLSCGELINDHVHKKDELNGEDIRAAIGVHPL
jgi:CRISPR-associated protein Csc2